MQHIEPDDRVLETAGAEELGKPVQGWDVFPVDQTNRSWIATGIMVVIGVICVLLFLNNLGRGGNTFLAILAGVIAMMMVVGTVTRTFGALANYARAGKKVYLFERGLIQAQKELIRDVVPFSGSTVLERQTRIIRNGVDRGLEIKLTISGPWGSWSLTGSPEFLTDAHGPIAAAAATVIAYERLQVLQQGGTVDFATVGLTPSGVASPNGTLRAWNDITGFGVEQVVWKILHGGVVADQTTGVVNDTMDYRAFAAILHTLAPALSGANR